MLSLFPFGFNRVIIIRCNSFAFPSFSESLLAHLEEYISGSQSKDLSSQFTVKQLIAKYFFNIVYYITLYQYYIFYKSNPQPLKIKRFMNIFILIIIMSSSVPILHDRLLDVLKVFLILSSLCFINNSLRMQRLLRIVVVFMIINTLFAFWQLRFFWDLASLIFYLNLLRYNWLIFIIRINGFLRI